MPARPHGSASGAFSREERLRDAAHHACDAEARGDDAGANEGWRRYRLIRDGGRDPDVLIAEGIELSELALSFRRSR